MRIQRNADLASLCESLAGSLISVCIERQSAGEIPCVVLTGGSGGEGLLAALASHPDRDTIDWARVRFLWGDERWAPAGHEDRNDKLADDTLFAAVQTDPELVHRVAPSDSGLTLDEAAAAYAETVSAILGGESDGTRAGRIEIAVSGVGPDGHVASLFPGRDDLLLESSDTPGAIPVRDSPKPPPERVSLTFPALNSADRSWLIAAGAGKADAVRGIIDRSSSVPAARLHGRLETVLWTDNAALG